MKFDVAKLQWTREPENYRNLPVNIVLIHLLEGKGEIAYGTFGMQMAGA